MMIEMLADLINKYFEVDKRAKNNWAADVPGGVDPNYLKDQEFLKEVENACSQFKQIG